MFQKINLIKGGDNLKRKNLIKFRIDMGYKSKDMADKLGITFTKYSNLENGRVEPSLDFIYKFQEIFDVEDVLELFRKLA